MKTLHDNSHYKSFIQKRNHALELILNLYLSDIDSSVDLLKQSVLEIISFGIHTKAPINHRIDQAFNNAGYKIIQAFYSMRKSAYSLSLVGEAEALRRALGTAALDFRMDYDHLYSEETPSGGSVNDRVELYLSRLKHKVLDAYKLSSTLSDNPTDTLARIEKAFPKTKKIAKRKKRIDNRKLYEANKRKPELISGFIDDATWEDLVDTYIRAYELDKRGPEYTVGRGKDERYAWEVEQELTEDFVSRVREGQIDAAEENGIKDFMWISILDDRTDECCVWRDGLSTSQIKQELKSGHKGDECDAVTPPAHPNCRCDIAPMTDKDFDTQPEGLGDFESWLTK